MFTMVARFILAFALVVPLAACAAPGEGAVPKTAGQQPAAPAPAAASIDVPIDVERDKQAISALLDDWHDAAAKADEARYFGHFTPDAVFLGTDATERWDIAAFRAFAHPFFARGKAWSFRSVRRAVILGPGGLIAWFDEDLDTPNMGPARGSGVLVRERPGAPFRVAHYNLALTIPNDRMKEVKALLAGAGEGTGPKSP